MYRPIIKSYAEYSDAVCTAYMAHNTAMLIALENDAKMNNTPHWYSETITDIEDMIKNYMQRFDG